MQSKYETLWIVSKMDKMLLLADKKKKLIFWNNTIVTGRAFEKLL